MTRKSYFKHSKYKLWKLTFLRNFPVSSASRVYHIKDKNFPFEDAENSIKSFIKNKLGKNAMVIVDYPKTKDYFKRKVSKTIGNHLMQVDLFFKNEYDYYILDKIDKCIKVYENV